MPKPKRDPGTGLIDLSAPRPPHRYDLDVAQGDAEEAAAIVVENPDDIGNLPDGDVFSDIARCLGELDVADQGAAKVMIWRLDARNPREKAFIDEITPQEFGMKWLMDSHGGGRYNVRVYVPQRDENGEILSRVKLAANKVLTVAGEPRIRRAEDTPNVPAKPDETAALAVALAGAMKEGFSQLAGLIVQNQPKPQSMMEMLQQMMLMKNILGGAAPASADPTAMLKSTLGIVKDITEMSALRGGGGDGDGGDGVMAVMMKTILDRMLNAHAHLPPDAGAAPPAFTAEQLALAGVSPEQAATLGLAVVPTPANVQPIVPVAPAAPVEREINPAPAPAAEETDMAFEKVLIGAALNDALTNAARNTPPAEYAERIYEQCPDSLFELLERADWLDVLKGANPRVGNFPGFFQALRDELLKLDAADVDDDALLDGAP